MNLNPAYLLFISINLWLPLTVWAQRTQEVKTEVKEVTVFLNRAQVTSTGRTSVDAGITELLLSGVPAGIDVNSLQVNATGRVTLYEVMHRQNYLEAGNRPQPLKKLEDSLDFYQGRLRALTDLKDVYHREEGMIMANQSIGGQKGVDADELTDVADVFRNRLIVIKNNIYKTEKDIARVQPLFQKYQNQVSDMRRHLQASTGQVVVKVSAESRTPVNLEITYLVHNAGWKPVYDIRATDTQGPVKLNYRAEVFQNTGINWNNVMLTLSTTNTTAGAQKPELHPYYLAGYSRPKRVVYAQPKQDAYNSESAMQQDQILKLPTREVATMAATKGSRSAGTAYEAPASSIAEQVQAVNMNLAAEFRIQVPYTVPSDNKMHMIDIQQHELKTIYAHSAVPKLDKDAFLVGRLVQWDAYNLLPGEANVFFEGTFTGKSYLNPLETSDTLEISLGRDKKIVIDRQKLKDYKSKGFLGSNTKETRGFEISIRNTKTTPVEITIEDQLPVSTNSQIEVNAEELSSGSYNKTSGKVTWQLKLNPNETKKMQLKYSVKYPKSLQIGLME